MSIISKNEKKVIQLPLKLIHPNLKQPRKFFAEEELFALAQSINENGLIQPITVRKTNDNTYEIIAGERRYRACKLLGVDKISCVVMKCTDNECAVLALIENIQRADLTMFEEAMGIQNLIEEYKLTQTEASKRLGKSQSAIANKLRLLRLTEDEREVILKYNLSERHARALVRIENPSKRASVLSKIIRENLNVNKTEALVDAMLGETGKSNTLKPEKKLVVKDVRIFVNTINKAIDTMRMSGINACAQKNEYDEYIEYTVKIPKEAAIKTGKVQ